MGSILPLRKTEEQQGFTKFGTLFAIPEWMFDERPHLVSRDDPTSLRYVCQVCGIVEPKPVANGWLRRRCACELALYESSMQSQAMAEAKAVADTYKTSRTYTWLAGESDGLESKTFESFEAMYQLKIKDQNGKINSIKVDFSEAFDECQSWVKRFVQARQYNEQFSTNLLLMGSYGTGKTHLAAAILNMLRSQCIPCLFCTAQGFFNVLYGKTFDEKLHLIEQASITPLLAIDELDKLYVKQASDPELSGAYQKRTLFDILDKRYKRRLPTIITTNEQQDLGQWLDGAALSRLYERITALPMNGVDYRSRGAK